MFGGREQQESGGGVNEHVNDDSCACHLTQKLISLTLFISVNFIKLITRDTFSRLHLIKLILSRF